MTGLQSDSSRHLPKTAEMAKTIYSLEYKQTFGIKTKLKLGLATSKTSSLTGELTKVFLRYCRPIWATC